MEYDDIFSTRGSETDRANPATLLGGLKEKLKSQSLQIKLLENYKLLCEQRILDLYPDHPLPVIKDHLGQYMYSETLPLKQKILKLERRLSEYCDPYLYPAPSYRLGPEDSLFEKFTKLERDKSEVEESLRNEMQLSEEQRGYIEVLRQALEINIEKLGLEGLTIDDFVSYVKLKEVIESQKTEILKRQKIIEELEYQVLGLRDVIELKNQENTEFKEKLRRLEEQIETNKVLKEDLERLEEEKNNLIEYIDNTLNGEKKATEKLKEVCIKLERTQSELERVKESERSIGVEKRKLAEKCGFLEEELEKNEKNLKESQKFFLIVKGKADEKEKTISMIYQEMQKINIENQDLLGVIRKLESKAEEKEREIECIKIENISVKELLEQSENLIKNIEEKQKNSENLIRKAEKDLKELTDSKKDEIELERQKTRILEKKLEEKNEEIRRSKEDVEQTEVRIKKNTQHLLDQLTTSLSYYRNLSSKLQSKNEGLEIELKDLASKLKDLEISESLLKESNNSLTLKLESYLASEHLSKIQSLEHSLESANLKLANNYKSSSEFQDLITNFSSSSEKILKLEQEVAFHKSVEHELSESLKPLTSLFSLSTSQSLLGLFPIIVQQVLSLNLEKDEFKRGTQTQSELLKTHLNTISKLEHSLSSLKTEALILKSKSEKQSIEISYLNESIKNQTSSLQSEISSLRGNLKQLTEEYEKNKDVSRKLQMELTQNRFKLVSLEVNLQNSEEKFSILSLEKNHLSNLIKKIQSSLESVQLQRILNETMRIHSELEYCSLEKLRISMQIRKLDSSEGEVFDNLKRQLEACECNISKHLSKLNLLDSELDKNSLLSN